MTFLELQDAVLFNSFGERYRDAVKGYLNAGARDMARRLEWFRTEQVVTHDADGLVDPTLRLHRVDDVWTADGDVSADAQAFRRQARTRLGLLPANQTGAAVPDGIEPCVYSATQVADSGGVILRVRVWPCNGTGLVAIAGLTLPTAMVDDADLSGLGEEADTALIAYARSRAFDSEDDLPMGEGWMARYELRIRNMGLGKKTTSGAVITPGSAHLL